MELKPCPFCGSKDIIITGDDGYAWANCNSDICQAEGPIKSNIERAATAWNQRSESNGTTT